MSGKGNAFGAALACVLVLLLTTAVSSRLFASPPTVGPVQTSPQSASIRVPAVTPRIRRYCNTAYALYFGGSAYGLAVLWLIAASRFSTRLRAFAERAVTPWPAQLLIAFFLVSLTAGVLLAPLTYLQDFWLDHAYGLSHESVGAWLADAAKGYLVNITIECAAVLLIYWLIRNRPRRWDLWLWACAIPLTAIGVFAQPLVIDPLFNTFHVMPPGPLEARIRQLAVHAGIPNAPIYVADRSKQTDEVNAYVTGIGASARIVIWDTTLQQLPDDEILGVLGHEMGHYVLKHIYWMWLEDLGVLLLAIPIWRRLTEWQINRFGRRWGIRDPSDPAAIPVFMVSALVLTFLLTPLESALSRQIEHAADAYGLAATHDGPAMARAFIYMTQHDLSDPYPPPFIRFWLYDHPPMGERIAFVLGRK